jgi:hypothetical protein
MMWAFSFWLIDVGECLREPVICRGLGSIDVLTTPVDFV